MPRTDRRQRQDAGKYSGADGDHHEEAHAKSADGCGQDKRADAKAGADLPDELLAGVALPIRATGTLFLDGGNGRRVRTLQLPRPKPSW